MGDIDSDNKNEFIYNGSEIYRHIGQDSQYAKIADLSPSWNSMIGQFADLKEPLAHLRIIPVALDLPFRSLEPEQTYEASLCLRNVWADAKSVKINIRSENDFVSIENGNQNIGNMKSGELAESKPIKFRIGKIGQESNREDPILHTIWIEITAQGGYKQLVPETLIVGISKLAIK